MNVLVTGATGFLGKTLTRRLLTLGVTVTAQGRNPAILAQLQNEGARPVQAELSDAPALLAASQDQQAVFHCAALSSPWGKKEDFYRANVQGTACVIQGCQSAGVKRLVYVSTPSIYFRFTSRLNVPEDAPLPARPVNLYAQTKLLAEGLVDQAFASGLPAITFRPRAIFGPGDNAILPRLIGRLKTGRLPVIGDGQTLTDLTYVDNVVDALLLGLEAPPAALGRKFNITNGQPVLLWEMVRDLCQALGYRYPRRRIPYRLADSAAALMEVLYRLLPGQPEPPLTRYMVSVVAQSSTLDISAARRLLGYAPRVSIEEGFERFIRSWKETPA
jgi:nucleoside-diphosphate-sugar epimerase